MSYWKQLYRPIGSIEDKTDDERENMSNWYNKRKDETSKVLVYNSYIYPTLGMT